MLTQIKKGEKSEGEHECQCLLSSFPEEEDCVNKVANSDEDGLQGLRTELNWAEKQISFLE